MGGYLDELHRARREAAQWSFTFENVTPNFDEVGSPALSRDEEFVAFFAKDSVGAMHA